LTKRLLDWPWLLLPAAVVAVPLAFLAAWKPLVALGLIGVVTLTLLVLTHAFGVLLILVAALPWEDALAYPSESITVVKLLGVLLFAAWLLRALGSGRPLLLPGTLLPTVLLGAAVYMSLLVSPDPSAGLLDALRYALYIVFFFLVVQLTETKEDVDRILRVFVLSATLASIWALYEFLVLGMDRAGGPISDPNDFAFVVACVLPLAAYLITSEPHRRVLWTMCFVLLAAAVLGTLSRGALVGLTALAVWGIATRRVPLGGMLLGVAAVLSFVALAFALWAPLLHDRLAGKGKIADANVASRQALWMGALRMTADRPVLGVGPGRFGVESRHYVRNSPLEIDHPVVHNSYLHVLAETGLIGFAAFLAFLGSTWRLLVRGHRIAAREHDDDARRLTTAMQAAMVVAVTSAFFLSAQLTTPFWLLGALATVVAGGAPARSMAARRERRAAPRSALA
jgi:putative inorganic carbon (HCO3(-)) transporter